MSGTASSAAGVAFSVAVLVVVLSWLALIAVMIGFYAFVVLARKRPVPAALGAVVTRRPGGVHLPGLDALRRADPSFDAQLLLDAAQTAMLLMFVATSTGDEAPISRVVTQPFWQTTRGRVLRTTARDTRRINEDAEGSGGSPRMRQQNVPVDYQASAAELVAVRLGNLQEVCVRVAYGELFAIVRPGAAAFAAGASATTLRTGFIALGRAVAEQASDNRQEDVSWVGADGHYHLTFVRPAGVQTDPAAALADRTCTTCGATYQTELATACQHCGTPRPMPWGQWRLASAVPVS
jgi:hypothetical protein